jgi:hypothetical protein
MGVKNLVDRVAQTAKLIDACPGLDVGIIARPDGTHAGRLIPCVALRAVFKVAVWAAGAVDADVARCGDVGTPVRLGHDSHHCNA